MKKVTLLVTSVALCLHGLSLQPGQAQSTPSIRKIDCRSISKKVSHALESYGNRWSRTVILPASGKFTREAHYVTKSDVFKDGYPVKQGQDLKQHLERSLSSYQLFDPLATYAGLYKNNSAWTPEEHGKFGQGSIGYRQSILLDAESELWMMNMMWARGHRPALNTKFLMSYNGRNVVVIAGFETGPSSKYFLGGVTGEVHSWLKSKMDSPIKISYLADQTIVPGPCNCL